MGTEVHVFVHGPGELLDLAQREIFRLERLWSRFLADSEITVLNDHAGAWVTVSPETVELVGRALEGWSVTRGRFDPTVLGDVIRSGYDRTFTDLVDRRRPPRSSLRRDAGGIDVDGAANAVRLPASVGLDPGGIGKGLAADLVADRLDTEGAAGALVNVGGDLRAVGYGPRGDPWTVEIDPAASGLPLATVALGKGGLATSTVLRRRWRMGGRPEHHIIDPRTGQSADCGVVAATVLASCAWQAEVLAKVALVGGIETASDLVNQLGADAVFIDEVGTAHQTPGFERFVLADRTPSPPVAAGHGGVASP